MRLKQQTGSDILADREVNLGRIACDRLDAIFSSIARPVMDISESFEKRIIDLLAKVFPETVGVIIKRTSSEK